MSSAFATYESFSPSLDALLEWHWLEERGLASANPAPEDIIQAELPLLKSDICGEWYWSVSSPHYLIEHEETTKFRRRWDMHDKHLDWGGKRGKFSTSDGHTKSYDLQLYLRTTRQIDWFAVGDADEILRLLQACTHLGKKRAHGYGEVGNWEVQEIENDYHLWGAQGQLMRPMPMRLLDLSLSFEFAPLHWGWRPPARLRCNQELCAMPVKNVQKIAAVC